MSIASEANDAPAIESVVTAPNPTSSRGVRAIGTTILSRIGMQGLNAITGILTARMLLPTGRGQLAAITLWSSFLAGLTTFGLPSALIFYIRSRPRQASDLLSNALVMSFLLSIAATLVGVLWMPTWLHQYPLWAIRSAQWFLIITPLCSLSLVIRGAVEASGGFSTSNASQLLNPTVTLVGLLALVALHRLDTLTASCAYIFAALPVFGLLAWRAFPLFGHLPRPSFASSRLLLSYGLRSYGIDLLGTLALQVDQVLVVSFLRPADLGVYVVMLSLSRMLNVFQNSVVMVLFPKAAGRTQETAISLTGRAARVSMLLTGSCALVVGILGPYLLRFFYGKDYTSSIASLRLLLVEVTLSGATFVLAQAFMALGRPGIVTMLQALGLSLSVPLMLLLIPRWGIRGAAFSLLVSTSARFTFIYSAFRFVLKTSPPSMLPQPEDFAILANVLRRLRGAQPA